MGSHAEAERGLSRALHPTERDKSSLSGGSTTVPARPGVNLLGSGTEKAQGTEGIERKFSERLGHARDLRPGPSKCRGRGGRLRKRTPLSSERLVGL